MLPASPSTSTASGIDAVAPSLSTDLSAVAKDAPTPLDKASTKKDIVQGGIDSSDDDDDYLSVWAIARGLKEEDDLGEEGDR